MARRGGVDRRIRVKDARPPVRVAPVVALSLLLLTGGWSLLWFFARYEAMSTFGQWLGTERGFGRLWTCPNERVDGFPLGIVLSCDHPTFKGPVADGVFEGGIAGLSAEARLYFPTNVAVTLAGPLHATEVGGDRRFDASWSDATLTLRGFLPANLDRGSLQVAGLQVGPEGAAAGPLARVGRLEFGFKPLTRIADGPSDLETTITADAAQIPALDAMMGSSDPLAFRFKGFATQVAFEGGATLRDILEPWSRAGGQLHIQDIAADKGRFRMTGSGRLGLDDEHRLEGRLDTGFSGLEPVAARLGLPLDAVKLGGMLSGLLGGKSPDTEGPPADLTLPLVAKAGHLSVGPVRTGVALTPLY